MSLSSDQRLLITGGRSRLAPLIAEHFPKATLYSRQGADGLLPLADLLQGPVLSDATTLLHLAWSTLPATAEQNPDAYEQHDRPLLEQLLQACVASGAHFIFFSTAGAIYGNALGSASLETDVCRPISVYGRAKLAAETLIRQTAERHAFPCTILRISNPYGYPVPAGRAQGIIPHAIRCAFSHEPLTLWGNGEAQKDFLYHTDFLAALEPIIARRLTGTLNVCAGSSHSINAVLALVEMHTGRKISTQFTPAPHWDVQNSRVDNRQLTAVTGWRPRITLDEGIRRAVAAYPGP